MTKWIIGPLVLLVFSISSSAQIYLKEGKNRYTFAQSTIGYDLEYTPSTGYSYFRNSANQLEKLPIGNSISPVIGITGLHFWGHAEFFTGFSAGNFDLKDRRVDTKFKRSGSTGAKIFPWAIKDKTFRPYLGAAISTYAYKQGNGANFKRVDYPLLFGLTYSFKHGLLEIGGNYHFDNKNNYYISRTEAVTLTVPRLSFTVDFKYFFDFSMQSYYKEKSGELESTYSMLKKRKKLSSLSIAFGPAYSFFVGKSSYNHEVHPYLDDHQVSRIYPDLGIGYYNYRLDASLNLSNRFFDSKISAYETNQRVQRNSLALEAYKFLGDYHGFVPFFGGIVSYEKINVHETEKAITTANYTKEFFTPGIIVGWDIRPTRVDWWGIRTNIRYFPLLQLEMPQNLKIDFQQIELNFLQLVLYPNRMYAYLKKEKN